MMLCERPMQAPAKPRTVLIVDDSPLVRVHLRLVLDSVRGLKIAGEAPDLPQGIRSFEALQPDLLVTDLEMPSGSGLELVRHARQQSRECTIVVFSGHMSPQVKSVCRDAGADHCFLKGSDEDALIRLLKQAGVDRGPQS